MSVELLDIIKNLDSAGTISGQEILLIIQGNRLKHVTPAELKAGYFQSADVTAPNRIWPTIGPPARTLGVNGDYAIDTYYKMFYGPKANNAWPVGFSIVGTKGDQGATGPTGGIGPKQVLTLTTDRDTTSDDNNSFLRITSSLTLTLTDLDTGSYIYVLIVGSSTVCTLAPDSGLTISGATNISGDGVIVELIKTSATVWEVFGDSSSDVIRGLQVDLASYWPLDEVSGARRDIFGPSSLTDSGSTGYGAGKIRKAAALFTNATRLSSSTAESDAKHSPGSNDFTISAWVYLTAKTGNTYVLARYDSGSSKRVWLLYYDISLDRFAFLWSSDGSSGGGTTLSASSFGAASLNTWYHVALSRIGTSFLISVNGVSDSTTSANSPYSTTGVATIVGGLTGVNGAYARLSEICFWNRGLSTTELALLYNSGIGRTFPFV